MTPSEACYEAACRMSNAECSSYSCIAVDQVVCGPDWLPETTQSVEYADLFELRDFIAPALVHEASQLIAWPERDFRTFMLLMASEALK